MKFLRKQLDSLEPLFEKGGKFFGTISVNENMMASEVLTLMNKKKITNLCVYNNKNKKKVIGVLHIHNLLNNF